MSFGCRGSGIRMAWHKYMNEHVKYLQYIEDNCLRCHSCRCFHSTSKIGSVCYGELATLLLHHETGEFPKSIFGCHQCGLCLKNCPRKFDAKEFMFHARAYLEELDQDYCKCYAGIRVDREDNIFSKLKKQNHIEYQDALLQDGACPRLFVPGCHMSASFPELTKQVEDYLEREDIADGMTSVCCGNPLYASGLYKEFKAYVERMDCLYEKHGVKEIITPCPSCYDFDKRVQAMGYLKGIEIKCLSRELADRGLKVGRDKFPVDYKISIHDSCPDRKNGIFADSIRELYRDFEIEELPHIRRDTICCGCGGLVPPYSQKISDEGKELKQKDFKQAGSDCVITTCFNCCKGLKPVLPIHQYLEDFMEGKS